MFLNSTFISLIKAVFVIKIIKRIAYIIIFSSLLSCGVSRQVRQMQKLWEEQISPDFYR